PRVALACARSGPAQLTIGGRSPRRAEALAHWLRTAHPELPLDLALDPQAQAAAARQADLIIQATPVGLHADDPSLLPPAAFHPGQHVMDLIYNPSPTAFLRTARAAGAVTADGLAMLAFQGERSFEIWTGLKPPIHLMLKTLEEQRPAHD
ncbi:MAG: shikimate dehydrogenase, partial [Candidatus Marinimicrobia bacterium]|nr:shikimate dehydrogenase [Candidatus Neomarinimicrobiota bacterium]